MTVVNVVAGAVIGVVIAPLVYLLATLLLTGPNRIPRTPLTLAALLASCFAAGVAITTSASDTVGDTSFTGIATVIAYGLFAVGVLVAALVDVTERRIPNRVTYPLIAIGVLALPWLIQPVTGWAFLAPLLGAAASAVIGLLNALLADQGLGDVKLAVAVGAWMAHRDALIYGSIRAWWAVGPADGAAECSVHGFLACGPDSRPCRRFRAACRPAVTREGDGPCPHQPVRRREQHVQVVLVLGHAR